MASGLSAWAGSSGVAGVPASTASVDICGSDVGVVFHWDSDGVASAALTYILLAERHGAKPVWMAVPRIGFYRAEAVPEPPETVDALLVLDYGIPGGEYEKLAARLSGVKLVVVDHHAVEPPSNPAFSYVNPVAQGLAGEEDYPACSLLVYERLLGSPPDPVLRVIAALGVAGDLAPFIDSGRPHPGLGRAERLLEGTGWSLRRLRELAEMIDSCYRLVDAECLVDAAKRLAASGPEGLYEWGRLREAWEKAGRLLGEAFQRLEESESMDRVRVYRLVFNAYVTSAVGRRLAAENPDKTIVLVHSIPSIGGGFIYVRSMSRSLDVVRREMARRGWGSGGKKSVAVFEYTGLQPPQKLVEELLEVLSKL